MERFSRRRGTRLGMGDGDERVRSTEEVVEEEGIWSSLK